MGVEAKACVECGAILAADSPQGLCPKCLLKRGLSDSSASAETVKDSPRTTADRPRTTIRYFGDYELLEEIARGGMGVVYKARQVSLNRTVAVKMILAGQLASEAEVKRFHTEAEAAANLQHPNIVAIHEVGIHEGQHYFSMDYVAGQNLAQTARNGPLPAVHAAELVKTIAEAVQYAHQRGILHRDLKPQNVLLDEAEQPRITDFGLAKRMEQDHSLTVSGAVLGSPGYMPPEQAAGRAEELGPASDVYALGAILYYLLTGQPPFRGETPMATLVKVLQDEPAPPSKLNVSLPKDLETICLKCLEKRPERRYATARMLAEELDRFLTQQPILARPAGPLRKMWSWTQRNPWVLAGVTSLMLVGSVGTGFWFWKKAQRTQRALAIRSVEWSNARWPLTDADLSGYQYSWLMQSLSAASRVRVTWGLKGTTMEVLKNGSKPARQIRFQHPRPAEPGLWRNVLAGALSRDGRLLAAAFADQTLDIFRVADGELVLQRTNLSVRSPLLSLSPDGRWLAVGDREGTLPPVTLLRTEVTNAPAMVLIISELDRVSALEFSPDGRWLAVGRKADPAMGRPPELALWNLTEGRVQHRISFFAKAVRTSTNSNTGRIWASTNGVTGISFNRSGSLVAVTIRFGLTEVLKLDGLPEGNVQADSVRLIPRIRTPWEAWAAFHPDGERIVWGTYGRVFLTDVPGGKTVPLTTDYSPPWLFAANGRRIISSAADYVDLDSMRCVTPLPGPVFAVHPDGTAVSVNEDRSTFQFWQPDAVAADLRRFGLERVFAPEPEPDPWRASHLLGMTVPLAAGWAVLLVVSVFSYMRLLAGQRSPRWANVLSLFVGAMLVAHGIHQAVKLADWAAWDIAIPAHLVMLAPLASLFGLNALWDAYRASRLAALGRPLELFDTPPFFLVALFIGSALVDGLFLRDISVDDLPVSWLGLALGIWLGYFTLLLLARGVPPISLRTGWGLVLTTLLAGAIGVLCLGATSGEVLGVKLLFGSFMGFLLAAITSHQAKHYVKDLSGQLIDRLARRLAHGSQG